MERVTTAWIFIATDSVPTLQLGSCFRFSDHGPGDVMKNEESDTEFTYFPSTQTVTKNLTCRRAHSLETIFLGKQLLRTKDLKADKGSLYSVNTRII